MVRGERGKFGIRGKCSFYKLWKPLDGAGSESASLLHLVRIGSHEGWVGRLCDGSKLKPFPACCVLLSVADRLVMLRLLIKVGVSALALMLAALPVAACVLPGAAMTSAERECCKKMAEQCGDMGMTKSHGCCKVTATPADFHALKTASSQSDHVSLILFHALPLTPHTDAYFSLAQWSSRVSCTHSPPGLESLATTILRI
jgi:hypothetical protein